MARSWVAALPLLVACAPLPPRGTSVAELAQGLPRVVLDLDDAAPDVHLVAAAAAGSAHDPLGQEGLASLTVRAMARGGAGARSPEALEGALEAAGGALEVAVGKELATVRLRCPRAHAETCLDLFADVLTAPRFEEATVARLRAAQLHALTDGLRTDEDALAHDVLDAWIFEGHPYGHPVQGRAGTVPLLTPDHVRRFHARQLVRQGVVLGVGGAVASEQVHRLMERMRALPARVPPELPLMRPVPVAGRSLLVVDTGGEEVTVRLGHPHVVTRDHPDFAPLLLGLTALDLPACGRPSGALAVQADEEGAPGAAPEGGDGAEGELLIAPAPGVEEPESGGAPQVQAAAGPRACAHLEPAPAPAHALLPAPGGVRRQPFLYVQVGPTPQDEAPRALERALTALERAVEQGVTAEALERARAGIVEDLARLGADPGWRLGSAVEATAAGLPDLLRVLELRLRALTADDVSAALARHVRPGDLRIVAVGGGGRALVDALPDELGLTGAAVRPVEGVFR